MVPALFADPFKKVTFLGHVQLRLRSDMHIHAYSLVNRRQFIGHNFLLHNLIDLNYPMARLLAASQIHLHINRTFLSLLGAFDKEIHISYNVDSERPDSHPFASY